jgi:hypothetical protein
MRRRMRLRRRGGAPFTFAVVLTVAAGLSLAEEHAWVTAGLPEGFSSHLPGERARDATPQIKPATPQYGPFGAAPDRRVGASGDNAPKAAPDSPGVGSRALTRDEPPAHK